MYLTSQDLRKHGVRVSDYGPIVYWSNQIYRLGRKFGRRGIVIKIRAT